MKLTKKEILKKIDEKCKLKNYTFVDFIDFKSIKSYFILKCNIDNYEWKSCYKNFIYQNGCCHKCAGNAPYTKDELLNIILEKCKIKNYTLLEMYNFIGNKTKIKLKCNNDDHEWKTDFHTFIDSDCGCGKCYGNIPLTKSEYMNNIYDRCLDRNYIFLEINKWIGNKTKIKIKCNNDDHEWYIRYDSFITNYIGCPKCADKVKFAEIFENKLKQLHINFVKEKTYENLKNINSLRFDYFINEHILIELDGNEHKCKTNKVYFTDRLKEKYCKENNIKLIRIKNKDVKNIDINKIL
jgi:very-short-patch-repair endonuclease